jgi:hypothetical protein
MNEVGIFISVLHSIPKPTTDYSAASRSLNTYGSLNFERERVGFQQFVSNCILVIS